MRRRDYIDRLPDSAAVTHLGTYDNPTAEVEVDPALLELAAPTTEVETVLSAIEPSGSARGRAISGRRRISDEQADDELPTRVSTAVVPRQTADEDEAPTRTWPVARRCSQATDLDPADDEYPTRVEALPGRASVRVDADASDAKETELELPAVRGALGGPRIALRGPRIALRAPAVCADISAPSSGWGLGGELPSVPLATSQPDEPFASIQNETLAYGTPAAELSSRDLPAVRCRSPAPRPRLPAPPGPLPAMQPRRGADLAACVVFSPRSAPRVMEDAERRQRAGRRADPAFGPEARAKGALRGRTDAVQDAAPASATATATLSIHAAAPAEVPRQPAEAPLPAAGRRASEAKRVGSKGLGRRTAVSVTAKKRPLSSIAARLRHSRWLLVILSVSGLAVGVGLAAGVRLALVSTGEPVPASAPVPPGQDQRQESDATQASPSDETAPKTSVEGVASAQTVVASAQGAPVVSAGDSGKPAAAVSPPPSPARAVPGATAQAASAGPGFGSAAVAVEHLAAGRNAEARRAYADLAARHLDVVAYAAIAGILKEQAREKCANQKEDCDDAVPDR